MCNWKIKGLKFFQNNPEKKGKVHGLVWKPVTSNDLYTFIGLLMALEITQPPHYVMYWREDMMCCGPPIFCREVMSCDRFLCIMKFLRFSSVDTVKERCTKH